MKLELRTVFLAYIASIIEKHIWGAARIVSFSYRAYIRIVSVVPFTIAYYVFDVCYIMPSAHISRMMGNSVQIVLHLVFSHFVVLSIV